jgi:aspartate carbamoyltransferase catalytic subunit
MRNLLGISDLSREQIERLLDRADSLAQLSDRENKKLPTLSGRTIVSLFFENSTRTSASFDLAAKRLSADTVSIKAAGSSVEKGESLRDTVQTLSAYGPSAIVVRSPNAGAPGMITRWTNASVINAGDGKHEHPTQALLDAYTLRRRLGNLDDKSIWIIGDVLHSRVARSNILALTKLGAHVTVCGPPTLIPREIESLGCSVSYTLDGSQDADVLYVLRMQNERMSSEDSFIPSVGEYASRYQINGDRLGARQLLMHPGPVNRGVELSPDVVDAPQSLITEQVASGVVVRMAVFYELLAGRGGDEGSQKRATAVAPISSEGISR